MRLEHYRKLYEKEQRAMLSQLTNDELTDLLIERYSIKDWKEIQKREERA